MRIISLALLTVFLSALSGCAAMSEQACLVTDWRTIGFEDGVAGRSSASIGNYRQACADYGVTPDLAEYRAGHDEGVEVYCRAGNGFEVGRNGSRYLGVCPANLEPDFLAAYNEGRQLYELEAALLAVDNQIAAKSRRTEEVAAALASASVEIVADETPATRRAELMLSVAAMAQEQGRLAKEIEALRVERSLREADLVAYRQRVAFASL
jgi:hypothetical protein